ncbi:(2Fe-2S)-binding protein [Herbaspirillum sp.]|uniref:(2Fe-2S)-binding protein n=1 Tax=Herbaspirillum sp. TaxID=1890675 RepID=UPI0031D2464C
MNTKVNINVRVNGVNYERDVEPRTLLSDFLRHTLNLTGTHVGCEQGVCGACTIMVNGDSVRACLMLAAQTDGFDIQTVEGLGRVDQLNPLQEAFQTCHGLQCGFCTPGMLMTCTDMLNKYPLESDHEIREGLSGNLCRCTGYVHIVDAVKMAKRSHAALLAKGGGGSEDSGTVSETQAEEHTKETS